jgi:hypothetical protein
VVRKKPRGWRRAARARRRSRRDSISGGTYKPEPWFERTSIVARAGNRRVPNDRKSSSRAGSPVLASPRSARSVEPIRAAVALRVT